MDFTFLKLDGTNLALSWELPYYLDKNGFLIVSSLDPQRYFYDGNWRLAFTPVDIQMIILTEWLDAGWCAAQPSSPAFRDFGELD